MMKMWTAVLVCGAMVSVVAWAVALLRENGVCPFTAVTRFVKGLPWFGMVAVLPLSLIDTSAICSGVERLIISIEKHVDIEFYFCFAAVPEMLQKFGGFCDDSSAKSRPRQSRR